MANPQGIKPVSADTQIEHRFYSIARWFGLFVTTAALIVAAIAAIDGLQKTMSGVDSQIRSPAVSYDDFRSAADAAAAAPATHADTTLQQKEQVAAQAQADVDFEKRLKPDLDAIVGSLTGYAAALDVAKPSPQAVGDYVRNNMKDVSQGKNGDLAWAYVDGLKKATAALASDGDRLAKLSADDSRRVRWDKFLDWYTQSFKAGIGAEYRRIGIETAKAAADKVQSLWLFYVAGASFGVFIYMTMLLVLLRIERNTRPAST